MAARGRAGAGCRSPPRRDPPDGGGAEGGGGAGGDVRVVLGVQLVIDGILQGRAPRGRSASSRALPDAHVPTPPFPCPQTPPGYSLTAQTLGRQSPVNSIRCRSFAYICIHLHGLALGEDLVELLKFSAAGRGKVVPLLRGRGSTGAAAQRGSRLTPTSRCLPRWGKEDGAF